MTAHSPYAILGLAVLCISTGSLFVRMAAAPPIATSFYRIGLAALLVAAWSGPRALGVLRHLPARSALLVLLAGVALGFHFATWISSLGYTSVAASVLLVNTAPIFTLGLAWLFLGERPTGVMVAATALALLGASLIARDDWRGDLGSLRGPALAMAGAVTLSTYHVIGRGLRDALPLQAYVAAVWSAAAFSLALLSLALASPLTAPRSAWPWFVALAVLPTVCGHGLVNRALRSLPAPTVGLFLLGEPLGAAILAYLFLRETPGPWTFLGGAVVVVALAVLVRGESPRKEAVA